MDNIKLLKDHAGVPVQGVMKVKSSRKTYFTTSSGAARVSGETPVVRIVTTVNCYAAIGGSGIEATAQDILMIANRPELFALDEANNYIAFKGSGEIGYAFVTCLE